MPPRDVLVSPTLHREGWGRRGAGPGPTRGPNARRQSSRRPPPRAQGSANTKTRSEGRGGGKKPYAQKGNGTARRGSQRTPLRVGGGITFGPKPRDFSIDMNRKERRLAMATALQSAAGPSMVVAEDLSGWEQMKTKALVEALAGMGADPMQERVLIVTGQYNEALLRSARNVARLEACTVDNLNIIDVLKAKKARVDGGT